MHGRHVALENRHLLLRIIDNPNVFRIAIAALSVEILRKCERQDWCILALVVLTHARGLFRDEIRDPTALRSAAAGVEQVLGKNARQIVGTNARRDSGANRTSASTNART